MNSPDTQELARRAVDGDLEALESLVLGQEERLRRHVSRRIGKNLGRLIDVEDVLQETRLKACSAIAGFTWMGEKAFYFWLSRIAEHVILRATRKQRPVLEIEPVEGRDETPSRHLVRQERRGKLETALARLSEDHRRVIELTRLHGLTIARVSEEMGRSPNAVKKLLGRALEQLRLQYGETTGSLRLVSPFPASGREEEPLD